jgi:colicin import membrane protein
MTRFLRENTGPLFYSVLLHGGIVAALVLMAVLPSSRPPVSMSSVPVNATVVDSRILHAAQQAKAEQAVQARAVADAQARAAAEAQAAAQKAAADTQAEQQAKVQEQQAKMAEQAKAAEDAKTAALAAKQAEQAKAAASAAASAAQAARAVEDARKAAQARQAADAKAAAEAKATAEAKAAADAKAAKAAAEAKAAADELRKELGEEEHVSAVEASPLRDRYVASLRNRIQNAWIKPPSARVGVDCLVEVTQVPGGEVTSAKVTQCNGDAAVRQSIENAVYRASPLPDPPDPALFQRNFAFRFKPDE